MKNILIIGLGQLGRQLCMSLSSMGNEIMIADESEERLNTVSEYAVNAQIADCTNEATLRSIGVSDFDICFVCIGENFQSSLQITSLLKELGAKKVVSQAHSEIHEKFLLRNGADRVIFPEKDVAERVAVCYSSDKVFDYFELAGNVAVYEIETPPSWIGKTVKSVNVRVEHGVNILGTKKDGLVTMLIGADKLFSDDEHLLIAGEQSIIDKLIKKLK